MSKRNAILIILEDGVKWINLEHVINLEVGKDFLVVTYINGDNEFLPISNGENLKAFLSAISFNVFVKTEKEGGDVGRAENL